MIVSILEVIKLSLRDVEKCRMMPNIASWLSDFIHVCYILRMVLKTLSSLSSLPAKVRIGSYL